MIHTNNIHTECPNELLASVIHELYVRDIPAPWQKMFDDSDSAFLGFDEWSVEEANPSLVVFRGLVSIGVMHKAPSEFATAHIEVRVLGTATQAGEKWSLAFCHVSEYDTKTEAWY